MTVTEPVVGVFVRSLVRRKHLEALLGCRVVSMNSRARKDVTHIAGWGLKSSADKARDYAQRCGLNYISLEDGFLRSLLPGVSGGAAHSLIADYSGVYYDATRPSDLESLIQAAEYSSSFSEGQLQRAEQAMALLRQYRLSKYNHAPEVVLKPVGTARVLVVDQTAGDASIAFGMASAAHFEQMLRDAVRDNPEAEVLVKIHPDVIAGKKQGHLLALARSLRCTLLSDDICPWSLLDAVSRVYVVTSQLGFEALLAGKEVICYGAPFYSGWGLTQDKLILPRRQVKRSLAQVFYAAYIEYSRYVNPYTGERCELEQTIRLLAQQKEHNDKTAGRWFALGFSGYKKRFLPHFLGERSTLTFSQRLSGAVLKRLKPEDCVLAWSSQVGADLEQAVRASGAHLWRMEDGFIRSVGLGVDLVPPLSLVLDTRGIYYDATRSSDLEHLLNHHEFDEVLLKSGAELRQRLVDAGLSKYNVGRSGRLNLPSGRPVLLVPGQVETDASIRMGSPQLKRNVELLQAVRTANPDAFIIYKPHPDVVGGGRVGEIVGQPLDTLCDLEVRDLAMPDLLAQVDEVHTLTSLTGFEALLRGIPVTTYGLPFYAGWGLTRDHMNCHRRSRTLTLDQLVVATLILYPTYVDPDSGDVIDAESAVTLLTRQREQASGSSVKTYLYRMIRRRK
ncbi:capsular polysaccharide biosynthesis protein [Nitrincola sp. MINF-07-Sa-05]|uniref:capsular polysaccharide biosynthesis protein n=1 Tax=Nitrincola salilacus TaxID=3400273 RepID=UPI003917BCC4